jgi:hypothetical protein
MKTNYKEGLVHISKRTEQMRYSVDKEKAEKWVQPISDYTAGEAILRGQPVSIAIAEDATLIATLPQDKTYLVLSNTAHHTKSIGLAMETVAQGEQVHVLPYGKFAYDLTKKATEYVPDFLFSKDIGKPVFVKGGTRGELTTIPEESYFGYKNIIQVGHVTDAPVDGTENEITLEVQLEGDGRGPIGATQFEAVLGEDAFISSTEKTKVFAFGCEDSKKFKLCLSYNAPSAEVATDNSQFIAVTRMDGRTYFIMLNSDALPAVNDARFSFDDSAFIRLAEHYAAGDASKIFVKNLSIPKLGLNQDVRDLYAAINTALVDAVRFVSEDTLVGMIPSVATDLALTKGIDKTTIDGFLVDLESSLAGGYFDVYVSSTAKTKYFSGTYVKEAGSYENHGKAVLADIRIAARQSILGIYNSGVYDKSLEKDSKALFLRVGEFNAAGEYSAGSLYYLDKQGGITATPKIAYDSTLKIGVAQTDGKLIVSCEDARMFYDGELPVGYIKPSVGGQAEFGFILADGVTEHLTSDFPDLLERAKNYFEMADLNIHTNVGGQEVFTLPEIKFGNKYAQMKYLNQGVYSHVPRIAVKRLFGTFDEMTKDPNGIVDNAPTIASQEITDLVLYGPLESGISGIDLESLDIRLFVDAHDMSGTGQTIDWVEIPAGFFTFNNVLTFGYRWKVVQTKPTDEYPCGRYYITTDTNNGNGVALITEAGCPPVPLFGKKWKVYVQKRETFSRQFDIDTIFANYVSQSLFADDGDPTARPVSGLAVYNYITNIQELNRMTVKEKLTVGSNETPADTVTFGSFTHTGNISIIDKTSMKEILAFNNGKLTFSVLPATTATYDGFDDNDLMPKKLLTTHKNDKATAINAVHGIKQGSGGKFVSDMVDGFHVGLFNIEFINANSAIDLGFIPRVADQNANGDTIIDIGNGIRYNSRSEVVAASEVDDIKGVATHLVKYNSRTWTHEVGSSSPAKIIKNVVSDIQAQAGQTKQIVTYYNFIPNVTSNLAVINAGVASYQVAVADRTSEDLTNISNANALISSIFGPSYTLVNYPTIGTDYAGGINANDALVAANDIAMFTKNGSETVLANLAVKAISAASSRKFKKNIEPMNYDKKAMQAMYEMPLARFQYNNEDDSSKKYLGFIIEELESAKAALASESEANPTTRKLFEGLSAFDYKYTDEQIASIKEYLGLVTDNSNLAQNVLSTVGLLLEGAKETQERLLKLEASVSGKDAPTLGGTRTPVVVNPNVTQAPLELGLNRVVRALSKEVFDEYDPTNTNANSPTEPTADLSRIDRIDGQVNGAGARTSQDEAQKFILLDSEKGATYPKVVTVSETELDPESGKTAANFDGLNDAMNRIVTKIDALTVSVNGKDNIDSKPQRLDTIRSNIEGILREVFFDGLDEDAYKDKDGIESTPFTGTDSRLDKLTNMLYAYSLRYNKENQTLSTGTDDRVINGKPVKHGTIADDATTVKAISPVNKQEYDTYATILDILVETVGKDILPLHNNTSLTDDRLLNSIASRLATIEASLDVVSDKLNDAARLEAVDDDVDTVAAGYLRIKSIQDFCIRLSQWSGIHFIAGQTGGAWESDTVANVDEAIAGKVGTHDVVHDIQERLKKNINTVDYIHARLGVDFYKDEYTGEAGQEVPQETYNLTSDIAAILKTLYGTDNADKKTDYAHRGISSLATEQFQNGNIITNICRLEYATPPRLKLDGVTVADTIDEAAFFDIDKSQLVADELPISDGNRNKYYGEIGATAGTRKSRLMVIEDSIRALRHFIGLDLLPSDKPLIKFSGNFTATGDGVIEGIDPNTAEIKSLLHYVLNNKIVSSLRSEIGPSSEATVGKTVYDRLTATETACGENAKVGEANGNAIVAINEILGDSAAGTANDIGARFTPIESAIQGIVSGGVEVTLTGGDKVTTSILDLYGKVKTVTDANKGDLDITNIKFGEGEADVYTASNMVNGNITYTDEVSGDTKQDSIPSMRFVTTTFMRADVLTSPINGDTRDIKKVPFLKATPRSDASYAVTGATINDLIAKVTSAGDTLVDAPCGSVVLTEKQIADLAIAVAKQTYAIATADAKKQLAMISSEMDNLNNLIYGGYEMSSEVMKITPFSIRVPDTMRTTIDAMVVGGDITVLPKGAQDNLSVIKSNMAIIAVRDGAVVTNEVATKSGVYKIWYKADNYEINSNEFTIKVI